MTDPMVAILRRVERESFRSTVAVKSVEVSGVDAAETTVATHYEGRAVIRPVPFHTTEQTVAAGERAVVRYRVVVDGAADVPRGAVVDVVSSPDPSLAGARLTVHDVELDDMRTNRVLIAEEATP